jgi:hypothetical protein
MAVLKATNKFNHQKRLERLATSFVEARQEATAPGNSRSWFFGFLTEVTKTYNLLKKRLKMKKLKTLLGVKRRSRLTKLIRLTTDRDSKTASRWAAALDNAFKQKIRRKDLPGWFAKPGGIAARARGR